MDPIANMFTQLKNAANAGQKETKIAYSKINLTILSILKNMGFVNDFAEDKNENQKYSVSITVKFKTKNLNELNSSIIRRMSRPGRRMYISSSRINKALRGKSEILISTPSGVMSGSDARKKGLGGELICEVIK